MLPEDGCHPPAASDGARPKVITGTAGQDVGGLGMTAGDLPRRGPVGPVLLSKVSEGGWGWKLGVRACDRLSLIGGQQPEAMDQDQLVKALKARPLELVFHSGPKSPEHAPSPKTPKQAAGFAAAVEDCLGERSDRLPEIQVGERVDEVAETISTALANGGTERVLIKDGTAVYETTASRKRQGRLLNKGDTVRAVGTAKQVGLHTMQPISPEGAVDAKYLRQASEARTDSGDAGQGGGVPPAGSTIPYLAGAKADIPVVPWTAEHSEPAFCGTIEEFREQVADETTLARLRNKVRVCSTCNKPCATSLECCNACGSSLADVPVSYNDNILMGFVYGISKGKFPYKISMRYQSEQFACFDDPLSLSPMHLLVIPTDVYVPDWRFLLLNPERGLKLIDDMFAVVAKVALEQFWSNDEFREKVLNDEDIPRSAADLMKTSCCGLNFPPSMSQLHIQFIHMPMTPFQYSQARAGNHFHHGRFFPLEYVRKALALGTKGRMNVAEETDIRDIMEKLAKKGVIYNEEHHNLLTKCWSLQERFSTWKQVDFEHQIADGKVFNMAAGRMETDSDPKAIQAADAKKLQNYGRPYTTDGATTGTYYKYAKKINEVTDFM